MIRRVPRRALLRGAIAGGAVAIGLPWLEIMEPANSAVPENQRSPARTGGLAWRARGGL